MAILTRLAKHDPLLKWNIKEAPRNAMLTPKDTQNFEVISTTKGLIQEKVAAQIRSIQRVFFSIVEDEVTKPF